MTIAMGRLEIETPDHVVLRYHLAGAGNRGFAAIVDFLIAVILMFAIGFAFRALAAIDPTLTDWSGWVAFLELLIAWLYFVLLEWLWNGQTIGKRLFGLRVISEDGEPARFVAVIVRNLVRVVDFLPLLYGLGLVALIVSPRSQRLGDYAAAHSSFAHRRRAAMVRPSYGHARPAGSWTSRRHQRPSPRSGATGRSAGLVREFVLASKSSRPRRERPSRKRSQRAFAAPSGIQVADELNDKHGRALAARKGDEGADPSVPLVVRDPPLRRGTIILRRIEA